MDFFSDLGYPCPQYTNPADHFMNILQTSEEADYVRVGKFVEASKKTAEDV